MLKKGVSCAVLVYMYIQFESVLKWYCVIGKGLGRGPKPWGDLMNAGSVSDLIAL